MMTSFEMMRKRMERILAMTVTMAQSPLGSVGVLMRFVCVAVYNTESVAWG